MQTLTWLVDDSFTTRLTVALLHFLWQGCCVGLLAWLSGALLGGATARRRYSLNVASLLLMAICLPVTFLLVGTPSAEVPSSSRNPATFPLTHAAGESAPPVPSSELPVASIEPSPFRVPSQDSVEVSPPREPSLSTLSNWRPTRIQLVIDAWPAVSRWIAFLYSLGVMFILSRLVLGVCGAHRLRSLAIPIHDEALLASFRKLAQRVGLRVAPTVAWCQQISVPVVVGLVKPMILLPIALMSNLTPDQVQALVLHELSHIRRYDPLVNLLQRFVEAVLFFHPAVWYVSRRICIERELAADDMVVAAGWDRPRYADALVRMAELASAMPGRNAARTSLAATGTSPSEFKLRILRLLDISSPPKFALSRTGILLVPSMLLVGSVFAWSQTQPQGKPDKEPPPTVAEKPTPPKGGQRGRAEAEDLNRLLAEVENKLDPSNSVLTTIDNGPANQSRAVIKQLDDANEKKLASIGRERLAKRWKRIFEQPALAFVRPARPRDPNDTIERGETVGIQTDLDGVWSEGKGTAENWLGWIRRKQDDYRVDRLKLLFEAAQGYRQVDDPASAERVLVAGLTGYEIYDADLKALIGKYWPVTKESEKALGPGPHAWTLVNFLTELSAAHQAQGEIEAAVSTHTRLTLAHFMLSWQHPSAGPTKQARELWSLIRQQPDSLPPLFWFNVVTEKTPQHKFDLSGAGPKGKLLTYHHYNLAAAPMLEFKELTITARTHGRQGFLDCYRINPAGKHESIGLLQPSATGEVEQTVTKTLKVPARTSLVQFMVGGDGFQVGEVTVDATFAAHPADKGKLGAVPEFGLGQRQDIVQWSHDSQLLYATGDFNKLTVWEYKEAAWTPHALKADRHANSLAASLKSPLLVAGTNVGTAEVWDAATRKRVTELRSSPNFSVYAVAISADDKLVAACGTDGTVHVFERESSKRLAVLGEKANTRMASLAFAPDGKTLAAMDRYGHLVLWKLPDATQLAEWKGIGGEDCSVRWSPDGKHLAASGWGRVTLIPAERGSQPRVIEAPEAVLARHPMNGEVKRSGPEPGGVAFASVTAIAPDLRTAASVAPDASIGIWDLATRKIVQTLPAPTKVAIMDSQSAGLRNLTFSPSGQRLACTTLRGEVVFWQLAPPLADLRLSGEEVTPEAITKLADRHWGTVTLAEARFTGEIVERLRHAGSIRDLRLFGTGLSGQIPRLEHITGLISLEIGAPLTGHDLEAIGQLSQLESLSLPQELTINVSGAQEIARLNELKSLRLYNVNIDDAAFVELHTLVGLEELDLTHTRITDEGLKIIEKMPSLRILELHRHPDWYLKQQLSDACLTSIARLPKLERLSLSGKITNDGLKQVARWPKLRSLSILNTEITAAGLEALKTSNVEQLTVGSHQLNSESGTLEHLKKCPKLKRIHVIGKPTGAESQWQERVPNVDWSFSS